MALTYQEFKNHLLNYLWRISDAELVANLDNLIQMGNDELRRELTTIEREEITTLVVDAETMALPSTYHDLRSVAALTENLPEFTYKTPSQIQALRANTQSRAWVAVYSLSNGNLLLVGPASPTDTLDLSLVYNVGIPDFRTTDASWIADEYLDLYTYACLKHTALFLREDVRLPNWVGMYDTALASVIEDYEFNRKRGISASKPLPRQAGISRRR